MSENENKELHMKVSSNPHIRDGMTTQMIMFCVVLSLMPATIYGVVHFGFHAFLVILTCVAACVATEALFEIIVHKPVTVRDCSAMVTGLLLALNLPPEFPLWMAILGSVFAILVIKMLFGGLGQNFMNPALGARAFLLLSFAENMNTFTIDGVTAATPLASMKAGEVVNVMDMIMGRIPGTIGETSMVCLIIGACFLILMGIIDLRIPGTYIVTFVLFLILFGGRGFDPVFISAHLAGGGLMLGAFFMATDYVTRPVTKKGQYLFGIFLGIMTGIFRVFGKSAEGVSYAIILGNLLVPLIEKITLPKAFGKGGERV